MQKEYRLKRRNDFRRVFRFGNSVANRQFVVYVFPRQDQLLPQPRIGISVSKKVGNAVVRNRVKRLVKEITRHWIPYVKTGLDVVIIARNPAATMDYQQVESSLRHVFTRAKLFQKKLPQRVERGAQ